MRSRAPCRPITRPWPTRAAELDAGGDHWLGLAGWGEHVVRMVGFNAPLPEATVEVCVAPAHYPAEVKAEVRAHASHVLLYYTGHDADPLEQYVAVAAWRARWPRPAASPS